MASKPGGWTKRPTILSPQVVIAVAGTAERIASDDLWVYSAIFQAHKSNTGSIYIASSEALCVEGTAISLEPQNSYEIAFDHNRTIAIKFNLKEFWANAETNGNKLVVMYTI